MADPSRNSRTFSSRDVGKRADEDPAALLDAIGRDTRDGQLEARWLNFVGNLVGGSRALAGRQQLHGYIGVASGVWKRRQFRALQVRMDAKSISPV